MKKMIVLCFVLLLTMLSCQSNDTEEVESLSILVPNGVPSIAQSYLEYNQSDIYGIDRISGPQPLVAAFTSESHDVIIAPVNLGANLYSKGMNYQLAGIVTWSNLQIISRFEITDISLLSGKDIIAYGEGSTPEMIIEYLFNSFLLTEKANITYEATSVQESLVLFLQNEDSIAIVSEPVTSQAKTMVDNLYVLDLSELWTYYTGFDLFPQAGIFVHKDLEESIVNQYLIDIEIATLKAKQNPSLIANYCVSLDYPFEKSNIESSIRLSQIEYQSIDVSYQAIVDYLELIFDFKPELIGNQIPDGDFYYPRS